MGARTAHAVYDALVEHVGAEGGDQARTLFVHALGNPRVTEYRFIGSLRFGGKFYREVGQRPDGSWGERWYVDCYPEDRTPERAEAIRAANETLALLQGTAARPGARA